jgi:hypothetical protein
MEVDEDARGVGAAGVDNRTEGAVMATVVVNDGARSPSLVTEIETVPLPPADAVSVSVANATLTAA